MKQFRQMNLEKVECSTISMEDALDNKDVLIIDVRTPKEYSEAHVKGAVNIPLMSDYQRHIIGRIYKQKSRDAAIEKGWDIFQPIVNEFIDRFRHIKQEIAIYCWRGGMRSRIVVNLLECFDIKSFQITGGFKSYMNDIIWKGLDVFAKSYNPKFITLFGNTGVRKTEILKELEKKGMPVLDLEGLAQHRSSVFGAVNLKPLSHKMFSILLFHKLDELKDEKYIFTEGESPKIGNVFLPGFISQKISDDIKINVCAGMETRVKCTMKEYIIGDKSIEEIKSATKKLEKIAGKKNVNMLLNLLDEKEYYLFTEWLLINYYDKRYVHAKKDYAYMKEIKSDNLRNAVIELVDYYKSIS